MSALKLAPRPYEDFRLNAKLLRNAHQVRLVRLEEAQKRSEKVGITSPGTKLAGPNSGQVDEPLGPPVITKRCRKRSESKRDCIVWTCMLQGVDILGLKGWGIWRRS